MRKKVVVAMSPKESLPEAELPARYGAGRLPTRQAGGSRRKKKVVIAMSGGLDSSVAAALLKRAGFDVVGVFMKFWKPRINANYHQDLSGFENRCCTLEAERRARKVAKILKIPFYVFNFEKEFKKRIVDYFLKEHKAGRTPNPCVVCNKEIKFGLLLEKALKLDADYIATGHYARLRNTKKYETTKTFSYIRKKFVFRSLLRAKDKEKDQSYFLWMLNQEQLKRILFPIGDYTRKEVENLARKFKLPVLKAKKSVEICFIQTTINDFLKKYLKEKPGKIICLTPGVKQKVVGEHKGLWFYTIGQRKGLGKLKIKNEKLKITKIPPFYVIKKDIKNNKLIVGNEKDLYRKELICKNVNWISGEVPKLPLKIKAKIRYRQKPATTIISRLGSKVFSLKFKVAPRAITPGQSVVFYLGKELLGGGIIG
jgi:tRNA-specific 2-thiouridylase